MKIGDDDNKLTGYRNSILTTPLEKSESVCGKVADRFENDLLEADIFPAGYFEFIVELLSSEQFYPKPGIWNFLLVLSTEKQKLLATHYEKLAAAILSNYLNYTDSDLCLAICDFIARNYRHSRAKELLDNLKTLELTKSGKGFADEGLWILDREIARSQEAT